MPLEMMSYREPQRGAWQWPLGGIGGSEEDTRSCGV